LHFNHSITAFQSTIHVCKEHRWRRHRATKQTHLSVRACWWFPHSHFLALVLQVFVIRPMSILLFGFPTLFDLAEDDRSMTPSITRSLVTFSLLPLNISGSDFSLAFYWVCMEDIGVSWSTSAVRRLCMHHVCVVILGMKRKIRSPLMTWFFYTLIGSRLESRGTSDDVWRLMMGA
jgi:hypothetical protein